MDPAPGPTDAPTDAVVLAGGRARRMGGIDKLALTVGGVSVLDRVLGAVTAVVGTGGGRVVIVGPERPSALAGLTWTVEDPPGGGPVPAVAAGLAALEAGGDLSPTVLVVAGDLARLEAPHLAALVGSLADRPQADAAVAREADGRLNPLLAAHRTRALQDRLRSLGPGDPASRMVGPGHVALDLGGEATFNLNSPADRERLEHLDRSRQPS